MATISLCMIVKDEEKVLARCLDSVRDAVDEIVIVDTGSADRTKEIAAGYTDKVYDFSWVNNFSAARNFAYQKAAMDYQMWLDADDILPEGEREKLLALKASLAADTDMVTMKYHTHFDGDGNPILTSTRERLTRREAGYAWQGPVHECIPLSGNILHSDITIWHRKPHTGGISTRNLDIYEAMEAAGQELTPRHQYYFARELRDHGRNAKAAYYFGRFLDGGAGWFEDNIAACHALAGCYRALGDREKVLPALLRGFQYDSPRAELCTEIGYVYKRSGDYARALRWFHLAATLEQPESQGFLLRDYWGYIPAIEACACAYRLGDTAKAEEYNAMAAKIKPDGREVKENEAFFAGLRAEEAELSGK